MTLAQLTIGSRGEVVKVEGVDEISLRLMEMGLVPGTEFTLLEPLRLVTRWNSKSVVIGSVSAKAKRGGWK